ncbi:CHAT domain-containing protein [Ephemerocybe angulata]|uniref:CHAT domain-containing protein n=1 Tax=Ephemerocybe angulata TaxID=980116 RepID=A0A8H6I0K0_9AGAR|nr:CHAT domain-containing protein [Tulosesus angulatus]
MDNHTCALREERIEDTLERLKKDAPDHIKRFDETGDILELDRAFELIQKALQLIPEDHTDFNWWLGILAEYHQARAEQTNSLEDLDEAILVGHRSVDSAPEDDEELPIRLHNLGFAYQSRFDLSHTPEDLDRAISFSKRSVLLTAEDDTDVSVVVKIIGLAFHKRFELTGSLTDLDEAIAYTQRSVDRTVDDDADLPTRLNDLGWSFECRFERTRNVADLAESIAMYQRAIELIPDDNEDLPQWLNNVASSLRARFEHIGELADINEAISFAQRAVDLTPLCDVNLPTLLSTLGLALQSRSERTGDLADSTKAILLATTAVELTPAGHADLPACLNNLGLSFNRRFHCTGNVTDLTEAITFGGRAVELAPEDDTELPIMLSNLGAAFTSRFEHTGDAANLDSAISFGERAVRLSPEGDPDLAHRLGDLGTAFRYRFKCTENLEDLAEAIAVHRRALQRTPEGGTSIPMQLNDLALVLNDRYDYTDSVADLAEAISCCEKAVQLTPDDQEELPSYLHTLSTSLLSRFVRRGPVTDYTNAVASAQRAVDLAPVGHPRLPTLLGSLGEVIRSQVRFTGNLVDLARAIAVERKALELSLDSDFPTRPNLLVRLRSSLLLRFHITGNIADLVEAISLNEKAVELTPQGHPDLPNWLYHLGQLLYTSWLACQDDPDRLEACLSAFKSAAVAKGGLPRARLYAAGHWAGLQYDHCPHSSEVMTAFDFAVELVSLVAGLEKTVGHRINQLREYRGIPLKAAAAACSLARPDRAVEWLERGRCLVWGHISHLRTPTDQLELEHPDLARSLAELSKQLENAGSSRPEIHIDMALSEKISLEKEARGHMRLVQKWDNLIGTIQALPGFEQFLTPLPYSSLMQHLPDSGFVVIVNLDDGRCDAIALSFNLEDPIHIALPDFSREKCLEYKRSLSAQLSFHQLHARGSEGDSNDYLLSRSIRPHGKEKRERGTICTILRSLWEEVVKPIVEALNIPKSDPTSPQHLPRIWWCPTGVLSFLPIHAAGIYSSSVGSVSIHDYAVSSYTPSVTTLTELVRTTRSPKNLRALSGILLTSQPNAPGVPPITGTTREVRSISSLARERGVRVRKLEGDDAISIDEYLKDMECYSSLHLACHASQNAVDPLQSRFIFHNGSLDLGTIIRKKFENADLAFLSACETSTGEDTSTNEAVHLAAGMLAAGYRRVVATMWAIGDSQAVDVAHDFYSYLWRERNVSEGEFDGSDSAYALHHAVLQLRQRLDMDSEKALLAWIPYVHFGY